MKLKAIIFAACAALAMPVATAWPQQQSSQQAQQRRDTLPADRIVRDRLELLDGEIASLMVHRAQAPADQTALIDLAIDLRIANRWLWNNVARGPSADVQAAAYARALAMTQGIVELEQQLRMRAGATLTKSQTDALARLHRLTFTLEDPKDTGAIDQVAREAATAMLNIASPNPVDLKTVPIMRPAGVGPDQASRPQDRTPTLAELTQEARMATVTQPLRAQLVAVATAAKEAERNAKESDEASRLKRLLAESLEIVRGLTANMAVSAEERIALEGELAAALALQADRRTSAVGQARMKALESYRQTLTQIGRLRLTPSQQRLFEPAFAFARKHRREAQRVLGAVEAYQAAERRLAVLPPEVPHEAQIQRAIEAMRQQLERAQRDLPEAVGRLGHGGVPADRAAEFERAVQAVARAAELLEHLYTLPEHVQILAACKPRPLGGLERRALMVASGLAASNGTPARPADEAALRAIGEMGALADDIAAHPLAALPAERARPFTGGAAAAFDERCRAMLLELANEAAAGQEINSDRLGELRRARELARRVRETVNLAAVPVDWSLLSRWADWTMSAADYDALLTPLQREMAGAVQAVAGGRTFDAGALERTIGRYEPILRFVAASAARGEELKRLPDGFVATMGKLLTPMPTDTCAIERYAGLAAAALQTVEGDAAERIIASLAARIAPHVRQQTASNGRAR